MTEKTILDNGIRIVLEPLPHVRSVSLGIWVKAGSRDESLQENGISHFIEHMIFKGTARRSAQQIAKRSRGTPRVANRLLRRVRDYADVKGEGKINAEEATKALDMMEVDSLGLDEVDRKILMTIIENFGGGPVGISTISAAIDEEKDTIESIYEPFLMRIGFLERTIRGRKVTPKAYGHLGLKPGSSQKKLFKE